jgi:hypothetical protein
LKTSNRIAGHGGDDNDRIPQPIPGEVTFELPMEYRNSLFDDYEDIEDTLGLGQCNNSLFFGAETTDHIFDVDVTVDLSPQMTIDTPMQTEARANDHFDGFDFEGIVDSVIVNADPVDLEATFNDIEMLQNVSVDEISADMEHFKKISSGQVLAHIENPISDSDLASLFDLLDATPPSFEASSLLAVPAPIPLPAAVPAAIPSMLPPSGGKNKKARKCVRVKDLAPGGMYEHLRLPFNRLMVRNIKAKLKKEKQRTQATPPDHDIVMDFLL